MVVAAIGIVINGLTAWLFASGRKDGDKKPETIEGLINKLFGSGGT